MNSIITTKHFDLYYGNFQALRSIDIDVYKRQPSTYSILPVRKG